MRVKEIKKMLLDQLSKMLSDKSYVVGAVASGLSIAIPEWIFVNQNWTMYHSIAIAIFTATLILDQITGRRLAKLSDKVNKSSTTMIDSLFRDMAMYLVVAIGYGLDWLIGSGSIIFAFAVASLSYHTFYSFLANAVVLGWGKNYPIWVFKWLSDEIKIKAKKYFKDAEIMTELDYILENNRKINNS